MLFLSLSFICLFLFIYIVGIYYNFKAVWEIQIVEGGRWAWIVNDVQQWNFLVPKSNFRIILFIISFGLYYISWFNTYTYGRWEKVL